MSFCSQKLDLREKVSWTLWERIHCTDMNLYDSCVEPNKKNGKEWLRRNDSGGIFTNFGGNNCSDIKPYWMNDHFITFQYEDCNLIFKIWTSQILKNLFFNKIKNIFKIKQTQLIIFKNKKK